jgi:DNA-binding response OmpR family regulator
LFLPFWHGICVGKGKVVFSFMTTHILIIEDDVTLSTVLADFLRGKGYVVETANNGEEGWDMANKSHYDLLLSDIMMPRMNGWQLLKALRDNNNFVPFIFLTAKIDREDIIRGYELGCDDYVLKPYSLDILVCKMEAVLRRCSMQKENSDTEFELNGKRFDSVRQTLDGKHLSTRENELLLILCQNMGKLVERNRILMSLWGSDTYFNARSLSVYVNHLRNYIGKDSPVKIYSAHGKGYKLVIMNE